MSLLENLELEEKVGRLWHRLVGDKHSWPRYPDAAVPLDQVRGALSVFFRGLGGDAGISITSASLKTSTHRLSWKQRIGMDDERMAVSSRDEVSLSLPDTVDVFADATLNRDLYFWLAAYFAVLPGVGELPTDALAADIAYLRRADAATRTALELFPGLRRRHRALCAALLAARPKRPLNGAEVQVEAMVIALLQGEPLPALPAGPAPHGYRPFLPVPLWGEALHREPQPRSEDAEDSQAGSKKEEQEDNPDKRRRAERKQQDNADRKDPLILNRFEKILAFADMVNVNRGADDPDEEEAKKAADEMDKITISSHGKKAATKLKFDLDLPPEATDVTRLSGTHLYPEWDHRAACYHKDHCKVIVGMAAEDGDDIWRPDTQAKRRIRQVKRQFEALRTKAQILRAQVDGGELDMEALVRARSDLIASGQGSDRVYMQRRPMERDLAVAVLVDASLSTDAWIENRRVLDVEKEALAVFSHGLAACDDSFAIYTFTSRKRAWVKVDTVKSFDEEFGDKVMRRIGAVKPGYYTRIGTAIRHVTAELEKRPNRHRLLLVITDGKPNDIDHYEGRYGIEDTAKSIHEARAKGVAVFGVTIDKKAQAYFPRLFGRGSYAIVHHLAQLTAALPRIYRHLVG
ncbi:nitric oxide reductase activation protein NorD [Magnetospirillum gryphiswaldense]|uniref:Nitric oxide reductase activation protein n=1 Tax=Magnetospirillum gryphiswaldense TaxID=55518 RepID=A4TXL9_9PROT|nr:VWA domain-containing protein [Magnetospirillum gryphiswaldense]AVM73112.1 von Willebrand factor type A domain protein [Magnetospirillum gryphiswaldense MSR-1]AVM77015.1 von Willebrand factor type A domain protein [Magnetospirillum gryphiswaldense]CAM75376.1 Nitric oxide reductase activation protein [Magnetospirillum gryphiswaldense MSR-1]